MIARISIVILYFIFFAAALTAGIAAFRVGLDSTIWPGVCALGGLGFTLAVPAALLSPFLPKKPELAMLLGPAMAAALVVFLGLSFLGTIGLVVILTAALIACLRLVWLARQVANCGVWTLVTGFLLVFILYFVGLAGTRYSSFVADFLTLGGRASADVYYHWSITNALRYFGEVAIGIDGMINVKYYPMAHVVAARVAALSNSDTGLSFIFTRAVFLAPLCLAAWALVALAFDQRQKLRPAMLAFLVALVVFLYDSLGRNFFDSESHILGLAIFGLVVPTALAAMNPVAPPRLATLVWAALIGCLALATATKVTTGFIILVMLGYVALRAYYNRPLVLIPIWIVSAVTAFLVYRQVISTSLIGTLNADIPGNFGLDWRWYYPIVQYGMALLALLALFLTARVAGPVWTQLRLGRVPMAELLGVTLIACTVPVLILPMPAGSGYYVLHPQVWVALAIVVAIGYPLLAEEIANLKSRNWRRAFAPLVTIVALIALIASLLPDFFMDRVAQMVSQASFARTADPSFFASRKRKAVSQDMKRSLPLMLTSSYYWPGERSFVMEDLAQDLVDLRATHGTRLAAYVLPQARDFWTLTDNCFIQPMILFGMTAVPLVDGLPPLSTGCHQQQTVSYGFDTVPKRISDTPLDDAALCRLAMDRGFDTVARIENLRAVDRVVNCSQ